MRRYTCIAALFAVIVALALAGSDTATVASKVTAGRTDRPSTRIRARPKARPGRYDLTKAPQHNLTATTQQDLKAALASLIRDDGDHVAVAVDDLTTGAQAACGGTEEFVTASIVKVDILATLLYQSQRSGQPLTGAQQQLATTMIENSDNDSASDLYDEVGGAQAIDGANRVFGLRETTVGTDGYWGLTTTTVDDQIRLLRLVFTRLSVLSPASQGYIEYLMSQVEADQRWGVPAAADPGTVFMVKNGWLPNPYLWEINSIGDVVHDHQRMLVAVLSDDNASEYSGISTVEAVARAAAAAMVERASAERGSPAHPALEVITPGQVFRR
jgi:beta-lactamase class A